MTKAQDNELIERLRKRSELLSSDGLYGPAADCDEAVSLLIDQAEEIARLTKQRDEALEALNEFMKCARCDPRMDGKRVFSTMDASRFGRAWMKYKDKYDR